MTVRKAVIPAAGLGTRFLPATKSQAKEMIPVVDRPGIQYVVEEAVRSGLTDVLIVTSRGKSAMEDHFDRSPELEAHLHAAGKEDELDEVRRIGAMAHVHYVRQKEPLGFGHAVLMAREHVGDEPFAVLVGDEIVPEPKADESSLLDEMIAAYEEHRVSVVAFQEVPWEDVSAYGLAAVDPDASGRAVPLLDFVEKPPRDQAPSNLAARGRYVLSPRIFAALERTEPGVGGEIQLTDAIRAVARDEGAYAYVYDGPIYDVGKKLDYLKATIELALRRDDLSKPLREWLAERTSVPD